MNSEYQKENGDFLKTFIEETFFTAFKQASRDSFSAYSKIEVILGTECDLKCEYCYYTNVGKHLEKGKKDIPAQLKNFENLMKMVVKNNMFISLDLFGGETVLNPHFFKILDIYIEYMKKLPLEKRSAYLVVPSNMPFLKGNETLYKKILDYRKKLKEIDIDFSFSASVDGPFMDKWNRTRRDKKSYEKSFYEKLKKELPILHQGFHPMVYSKNIEHQIDNFLFFAENYNTYMSFLEVRNGNWTNENLKSVYYFYKALWSIALYQVYEGNVTEFIDRAFSDLRESPLFNSLFANITTTERGIGCSLQSTLVVHLNNMEITPCHRQSYDHQIAGKLLIDDEGEYSFIAKNPEFYIVSQSVNTRIMTPCNTCAINELCFGGCPGSNYEITGEPFTVSPTVCKLEFAKIKGIVDGSKAIGMEERLRNFLNTKQQIQFDYILNIGETDELK